MSSRRTGLCTSGPLYAVFLAVASGRAQSTEAEVLRGDDAVFEEAQLYSLVKANADGTADVHLADDHPGASDPVYRERRNHIAAQALAWAPGAPVPRIEYTDAEHEVWRIVSRE